jgi:hypothetical protein
VASSSGQRTASWILIGVGGVGVVTGAITGAMVLSKKSTLDEDCRDARCPITVDDTRKSYNSLRTITTVAFIAGGVAGAAGMVLLLTAPSQEPQPQVSLWLGPASAGVGGTF